MLRAVGPEEVQAPRRIQTGAVEHELAKNPCQSSTVRKPVPDPPLHNHLATFPPNELTLPWDRPDGAPHTVSLLLTSREHIPVNRNYFNAKIWKPALITTGVSRV